MLTGIEAARHERVWLCGGGDIAGQLLRLDRVDEVIATVAPTVLGAGPALFDGPDLPLRRFRLEECRAGGRRRSATALGTRPLIRPPRFSAARAEYPGSATSAAG